MKNKDITPYNEKGELHGYCESYQSNGSIWFKCFFNNGKQFGYEECSSYLTKKLTNKTFNI